MTKINLLNAFPGTDPTCRRIPLTQGQAQLVDDKDYERLSQNLWYADWNPITKTFYAVRDVYQDGKKTTLRAHREIMGLEPGDPREVHHVNGNSLDNRRENLKVVTPVEHANEHRNDPRKDASQYGIGVYRQKNGRFRALARVDGKNYCLGTYNTPEEAQQARQDFLSRQREGRAPATSRGF